MNPLEQFIQRRGLDAVDAMNRLQDAGAVSDSAIEAKDVAHADCKRAIAFLSKGELDF